MLGIVASGQPEFKPSRQQLNQIVISDCIYFVLNIRSKGLSREF